MRRSGGSRHARIAWSSRLSGWPQRSARSSSHRTRARKSRRGTSRRITLIQGEFGADLGLGFGTNSPVSGAGAFVAAHYGVTSRIELSVRDGVNFGKDAQTARAEQYGHMYLSDGLATPTTGAFSSPELLAVGRIIDRDWFELGLDASLSVPVEPHIYTSATVGAPVAFHYTPWLRVDTGFYFSATFKDSMERSYLLPAMIWFQPGRTSPVWFGPITGLRFVEGNPVVQVPLGFGAGYSITPNSDIRAEVLVPQIANSPGTRFMGGGAGVQMRF